MPLGIHEDIHNCLTHRRVSLPDMLMLIVKGKILLFQSTSKQLIDAYVKEVRSLLELAVPVWHCSISKSQCQKIERVQKVAIRIILKENYQNYDRALEISDT